MNVEHWASVGVHWALSFGALALVCSFVAGAVRKGIYFALGKKAADEPAVKAKFVKREPGRASQLSTPLTNMEPEPGLSTTAAALEAFDPAELESSEPVFSVTDVRVLAPQDASQLADRLAAEFDAQAVPA